MSCMPDATQNGKMPKSTATVMGQKQFESVQ